MAFDISTAQSESRGFDINSAKPVEPEGPIQTIEDPRVQNIQSQIFQELSGAGVSPDVAQREARRLAFERVGAGGTLKMAAGLPEAALNIASGLVAEPIAGLVGAVQALNPLAKPGAGARAVEGVREALTFDPITEAGQFTQEGIGKAVSPVIEAPASFAAQQAEGKTSELLEERGVIGTLGQKTLDATGSPTLATAVEVLPTAVAEALGLGAARKLGGLKRVTKTDEIKELDKLTPKDVDRALIESAPDIDRLKDTSRQIYKEIDDFGVTLRPNSYKAFLNKVLKRVGRERINPRRTPESAGAVEEFTSELDSLQGKSVSDLDDLRAVARDLSISNTPADSRIGAIMLDEIDEFMDKIPSQAFEGKSAADAANIGIRYRAARKLWGRARRSELISEAMDKAGRQASGFENGIRTQLRQILNNKKKSRFFTPEEIASMDDVVKGTNKQNILKLVGRLGFSEGQATNILGGLGGAALGGAVGGPAGATAVGVLGQIFRGRAQRATIKNARLADAVVRAGTNGRRVVEAYLKTTPKSKRNINELSNILSDPSIELGDLLQSSDNITKQAAEIAAGQRSFLTSGLAGAGAPLIPGQATEEANE